MSQAEKRARQMQEMGIDASDIPTTSTASVAPPPSAAAAAAGVRQSQPAAAKPPAPAPDARGPSAATVAERSNSNTPSLQNAVVVDKKKGQTHASNASTHCTHRQDVHERRRSCTVGVDTKACYSHYLSFHSNCHILIYCSSLNLPPLNPGVTNFQDHSFKTLLTHPLPSIIYFPLHVIRLSCLGSERPHCLHVMSHAPKNIAPLLTTP